MFPEIRLLFRIKNVSVCSVSDHKPVELTEVWSVSFKRSKTDRKVTDYMKVVFLQLKHFSYLNVWFVPLTKNSLKKNFWVLKKQQAASLCCPLVTVCCHHSQCEAPFSVSRHSYYSWRGQNTFWLVQSHWREAGRRLDAAKIKQTNNVTDLMNAANSVTSSGLWTSQTPAVKNLVQKISTKCFWRKKMSHSLYLYFLHTFTQVLHVSLNFEVLQVFPFNVRFYFYSVTFS